MKLEAVADSIAPYKKRKNISCLEIQQNDC